MYKPITIAILIFISFSTHAQNWHEADSLRKALSKSNPDTSRAYILLNLAEYEILKPGELKTDLDSGANYINQAATVNQKLNSTETYGFITRVQGDLAKERGQMPKGKALNEKAIQILSKGTDKYQLGQAYLNMADYYSVDKPDEIMKKKQAVIQAANIFQQGGYIERAAYSYRMGGDVDTSITESLKYLGISLKLYQSIHYKQLQGVYDLIGANNIVATNYGLALQNELMALGIAKDVKDTTMQLCEINNHIGITYYKLLDSKQSIKYFEAALVTAERYKDIPTIYTLTLNIATDYRRLHNPQGVLSLLQHVKNKYPVPKDNVFVDWDIAAVFLRAYTNLKQYDKAKPYSDHLLSVLDKNKFDNRTLSDIYENLINYYAATKQYAKEVNYLTKNGVLAKQIGSSTNISVNNRYWYDLDIARHDYKSAVNHLLIYMHIYQSDFTAIKNKQIQELQIKYDTKEKEDKIKLLNQQHALEQNNLLRETTAKNVTTGGIVLALIIAGLLYRQSSLRKKNNELITQKNDVITHKNELLQNLVNEKEWLLKEVHHRVKNNLHSVICLLESQAAYLEDDALKAIEESQHRIYTMSLIHQKLYQSEDVKTIDMSVYIPELVQYLSDSFAVLGRIHFRLNIDPINLNPTQAIPLALIINEALTNSIKYAFPDNRRGEITITLTDPGDRFKLELTDNGVGMSECSKTGVSKSLGLELMKGLAKEIMGEITFENNNGVRIIIIFEHDALNSIDISEVNYFTSQPGEINL
jgi:two-component sensor histidine kinase